VAVSRAALEHALAIAREQVLILETALQENASDDDLISLKEAEGEFRISNDTARRWAADLELGEIIGGRWFLSRRKVRSYRRTRRGGLA
jgi:hypothetical protein